MIIKSVNIELKADEVNIWVNLKERESYNEKVELTTIPALSKSNNPKFLETVLASGNNPQVKQCFKMLRWAAIDLSAELEAEKFTNNKK